MKDLLEAFGLNASILLAGGAGGLLRALSSRRHSLRERIVSPVCGAIAAGYLTSALVHYLKAVNLPLPEDPVVTLGAIAFLIGTSAMWISDAVMLAVIRRLKDSNP